MFTGLVEAIGTVKRVEHQGANRVFAIEADFTPELRPGESVAVNGCCLTVVAINGRLFKVEAVAQTLKSTNLNRLVVGVRVNLERALKMGERIGGHLVLGHIDEVGVLKRIERRSGETRWTVGVKEESYPLLVPKGSVAVDGVSLTVVSVEKGEFRVNLIPFTLRQTVLGERRQGDKVNIEYDILVKSAQRSKGPHPAL